MLTTDIRLICAATRGLEEAIAKGEFQEDLFYRLSVVPIFIPPLRERQGDIALLAKELLSRFNEEHGGTLTFSHSALEYLSGCAFPGNITQLRNYVFRAATLAARDVIDGADFIEFADVRSLLANTCTVADFSTRSMLNAPSQSAATNVAARIERSPDAKRYLANNSDQRSDREKLTHAMIEAGWVQAKAARLLGLTVRQVGYSLKKHDIPIRKMQTSINRLCCSDTGPGDF